MRISPVALAAMLGLSSVVHANIDTPDPTYEPSEVVEITLRALARPDDPDTNAGIERSFRFSSPDSRAQTGPLDRFIEVVNHPIYQPLLEHERAVRGKMVIEGDVAREEVRIIADDGSQALYAFVLARQPEDAPCGGCWLTDAVIPLQPAGADAT